ncbi:glycosyltransferase family 4 protein [Ferruginibacter albus]|uniref:glycosyltransferase family 4 protein n=1 Tax=Ferruginibacter albus TaxID=2875540 RepID=UPI001CC3FE79|nr:glycosyltransferase family 1 protein [Ferruginibacter albus]UAY53117.1 glycosyltransferase family 4 protein [Ferruginibacter albus]
MAIKTIIDGALLAECEITGSVRFGMHRVAEEITERLIKNNDLDISFANTIYSARFHRLLNVYLAKNYPSYQSKVVSGFPVLNPEIPVIGKITDRLSRDLSLKPAIKDLDKNDLFFSYYYPFPKSVQNAKIKKCITYLDIIALRMEGYNSKLINLTRKIVESIVPNYAIAISEYSKQDICDYDKRIDANKIFVVPLAASPELFYVNKEENEWKKVKEKYKLPDEYFLCISSTDHRKNLPHIIKSFGKLAMQQNIGDLHLVMTGNMTLSESVFDELNIDKKVRNKIVLAKSIANEDMSAVYSNAKCFYFMSKYEGFGLPVLEAMQCGIPVVSSNASSLPEVVGDAGIMLSPTDEDGLCDVMYKMYSDAAMREKYAALSLQQAKTFSWQRCADEYAAIFKKIVQG